MARFINAYLGALRVGSAVAWLATANVAMWLLLCLSRLSGTDMLGVVALPSAPTALGARPWTLLTYMVAQSGFLHLVFNMLWLWWFGVLIEKSGRGAFVWCLYIVGGIAGAVAYVGVSQLPGFPSQGLLAGASAAVMAMAGGAAVVCGDIKLRFLFLGEISLKWLAIFAIALAMIGSTAASGTSHAAGAIAGVIAGLAAKRPSRVEAPRRSVRRPKGQGVLATQSFDSERLDELLDKMRHSGFKSLTEIERAELQQISQNLSSR